jgi:hypothetical protein
MIFVFLVVLIVALIIANVLLVVLKPKKSYQKGFLNPGFESESERNFGAVEIMTENKPNHEETIMINGSIKSMNQKMGLINTRLLNLERAVSALVKEKLDDPKRLDETITKGNTKIDSKTTKKIKDLTEFRDDAKIRLEVLEKQLEEMKGKPLVEKKKLETFDKKTEADIRALVYNTGRK